MQKTASVSHFLFEGALGNSALLLLYFDFRLGERALRPAQLLYEQPFAFLTISDAGEIKRRRGIPLPRSGFCTVVHVRPPPIIGRYVPLPYGPNEKPPTR